MQQQQLKKKRKRRYAAPVGGLFIGLAVLGVITVVYACFRLTAAVLDNSSEKLMFENIVRPVVMFDPAPFEKATDISMDNLLTYSMWSALMGEKRDTYQFGENGELIIPASDLDVVAAKLFGQEVKLTHYSFGDYEMFYFYDEPNQVYNVPVNVLLNVYTPEVETITKNGDLYEISVGYLPSGIAWNTDYSGGRGKPEPEKYMNYFMQKSKTGYTIVKLQYPVSTVTGPLLTQSRSEAEAAPEAEKQE